MMLTETRYERNISKVLYRKEISTVATFFNGVRTVACGASVGHLSLHCLKKISMLQEEPWQGKLTSAGVVAVVVGRVGNGRALVVVLLLVLLPHPEESCYSGSSSADT